MKKGIAVFAAVLAVSCFFSAWKAGVAALAVLGVILAALAAVFWFGNKKTRPAGEGRPGAVFGGRGVVSKAEFDQERLKRDSEIIQDSLRIMGDTKHIDTFCSRYKVARDAACRVRTYSPDQDAVTDMIAAVDEGFMDCLMDTIDRELSIADGLKTIKGRKDRAQKVLSVLVDTDAFGEGSQEALDDAIGRVESYIARQ